MRRAACLVAAAFACAAPAEEAEEPAAGESFAAEWSVSQGLWGEELLVIDSSRRVRYDFESAEGKPSIHTRRRLSAPELEPLRAATRDAAFCALRSARDGIPDEGQPSLTVSVGGRACSVSLWDGEWEEMPAARPALEAVKALIARMRSS